jgi:UDP-glucose 4-epimerase
VSVAELVALLGEVMGIDISVSEDPARKRRVDRPSQLGATTRIETRLGFRVSKSLRIALEDIVRHQRREPAPS